MTQYVNAAPVKLRLHPTYVHVSEREREKFMCLRLNKFQINFSSVRRYSSGHILLKLSDNLLIFTARETLKCHREGVNEDALLSGSRNPPPPRAIRES